MTTPTPDSAEDEKLREEIDTIMLITGKKRGQRIKDAILQLITQRDTAIRLNELDRYPAVITKDLNDLQQINSIQAAYYNKRVAELKKARGLPHLTNREENEDE